MSPPTQLAHKGLVKLAEECGELIQVAMKKVNIGEEWSYYDGKDLRHDILAEIGDVIATIDFVRSKLGLLQYDDGLFLNSRIAYKLSEYEEWDKNDMVS